jgi:hypothetical protein
VRGADRQTATAQPATDLGGRSQIFHPAFGRNIKVLTLSRPIPEDDETTTAQTIGVMSELARRDSTSPTVRRATTAAIAGAPDKESAAAAIHRWIRRTVHFVQDATLAGFDPNPEEAEVLVRPIDLLAMPKPSGDCDDFSMLAAAMLAAAGIGSAFKTVAADSSPDYSHVYVVALLPSGAVPLDASHGPFLGWEAPAKGKTKVWPIDQPMKNLRGLGIDWDAFSSVLNTGITDATKILAPRYAVPQLNAGQYIQTANGIMYQQPAGSTAGFSLPSVTSGNTMLYLIGGLAVVLLVAGRH